VASARVLPVAAPAIIVAPMPATTIPEVIERLDSIIENAKRDGSSMGYFAVLYRGVTVAVHDELVAGSFDDGPRMEALDVVFANRYLDAQAAYTAGTPITRSWRLAFETTRDWWPIVLQHLLLGMNAHINVDLGIAAAQVAPGSALPALRDDFDRINGILAGLVDSVQSELASIWPLLRILDHTAARTDEAIINFAMARARDHAWGVAQRLAPLSPAAQGPVVDALDSEVVRIGNRVRKPGPWISTILKGVRLGELGSVRRKIEALQGTQ